ncbi:beta-glucosidase family protein [Gordonia malaquae]|uniref:beta-glucosidase family protein n=1 Tax=Gordonia malaquae TaxID=410332 RepID=UPI0030FEED46
MDHAINFSNAAMNTADLADIAALTTGAGWWSTRELTEAGVTSVLMADGPHGIRFQQDDDASDNFGLQASSPATCFPPAVALASAWSPDLARRVGSALAAEAVQHGIGVVLGPGINIKRSPLGGRNFEYFSEDPYLTASLASAWVQGLQSAGVGASLKHFAVNNQETRRMTIDAQVSERPLREIYLRAFERVVRDAQPWTIMCSYNKVNGEWASQNKRLLSNILRDEWGYEGLVVSDWGAVVDRVAALEAGLDLAMPASSDADTRAVVAAVERGTLDEAHLRQSAARVAALSEKVSAAHQRRSIDLDDHHELAQEVASNAIVLLRNDSLDGKELLPLDGSETIALIGELARTPRYQGSGSSRVVPTRVDTPLERMRDSLGERLTFTPGYALPQEAGRYATSAQVLDDTVDSYQLRQNAVSNANGADTVVLFLGTPSHIESEGYDRSDLELPPDQIQLLEAVRQANRRVIVVLSHGSPLRIGTCADNIPAVLDAPLLGQAGGAAVTDVLTGVVTPSGKLTETYPLRVEDTPAFLDFPGNSDEVVYSEGIYVGYRWYDARNMPVAFPFGHGLSYTTFDYSDLSVTATSDRSLVVSLTVSNVGKIGGREVVQVYTGMRSSRISRAPRQLCGYDSLYLAPGESRTIEIPVNHSELAYWDTDAGNWRVEPGEYAIEVGSSSRDIRLTSRIPVRVEEESSGRSTSLGPTSTIRDWISDPNFGPLVLDTIAQLAAAAGAGAPEPDSPAWQMLLDLRLAQIPQLRPDLLSAEGLTDLMEAVLSHP